ncbi:MAG TPA: hypothetical protein VGE26_03625 [Sphingobacteriaceae bacterium]
MKRLFLCLALIVSGSLVFAQNKISEGTITYDVEWQLPEQMQPYAAMFPKEVKVFFQGDSASWKNENQMSATTTITNVKAEFTRLLLDIPMMGKKFAVTFTPADVEKMADKMPEFVLTEGTETKTIAGYNAKKYSAEEKKSGSKSEAWFTKEVEIPQNSFNQFFDAKYGFPVEFNTFANGLGLKAKVKEVKAGAVPAGVFSTGKDYETMSLEQLMQMQGGQ